MKVLHKKHPLALQRRRVLHAGIASVALIGLSRRSLAADDKILIGYWPIASGLPLYAALERGFFKEAGLQVEGAKFASAQQVAEAMISGPHPRLGQRHRFGGAGAGRDHQPQSLQDHLQQPEQPQAGARRVRGAEGFAGQEHRRARRQEGLLAAPASRT